MATSQVSPQSGFPKNANERVQRQIVDTNFVKQTVVKSFNKSIADSINSVDEAVTILGQDEVLAALKAGILNKEREKVRGTADGWFVLGEDNTDGGPYSGEQLDNDKVNTLVLNLAKIMYAGIYATDPSQAKANAVKFLQSSDGAAIRASLVITPESE